MAQVSSKHRAEDTIVFSDFTGGINYSVPPDVIADNELSGALNFFYDPNTFRLKNRPGLSLYSESALPTSNPVTGGFFSSILNLDLLTDSTTLYKFDSENAPVVIDTLTGSERPYFIDFNGKVLVASGGVIQATDGTNLPNVSNAPSSKKIMTYMGRVVSAGDPSYPHRLSFSAPGDETDWDSVNGSGLYFDVALGVGDGITDFNIIGDDIIIFKGIQEKGIYRLVLPNIVSGTGFDAAYIKEESKVNSSVNFSTSSQVGNDLLFLDNHGVKSLISTQKYGDIEQDETGRKINSVISTLIDKTKAFVVKNPAYSQIWIKYADQPTIYVYHWVLKAFLVIQFQGLTMLSAWYHEEEGILLIGMNDGNVYKLDNGLFTDNGTAVPAHLYFRRVRILTNLKTLGTLYRKLLKQTIIDYEGISAGTGSLQVEIDGGIDTIPLATLTLNAGGELLYDSTGLLYDDNELLYEVNYSSTVINKLVNFYDIRPLLSVASGGMKLNRLEQRIAISGRR